MDLKDLIARYVDLRDKKAQKKAEFDSQLARYDEAMGKIENVLLATMNQSGLESVRAEAGTAYKAKQVRVGVADWDAIRGFIAENDAWYMLDKRVSKTGVLQYKEEHGALPPGLNYAEEFVINVRRG